MTVSFKEGTHVQPISANTYLARLNPDWCVGSVPHGGYVTSIFLSVAKLHFDTTRVTYEQPHTIGVQLNFLRRTSIGPGTFTVTESKLGRRTSTIHIALNQEGESQPLVVGYFTQSNINTETGISVTLPNTLYPSPVAITSSKALREGTDPNWRLQENKFSKFRKAGQRVLTYLPRNDQAGMIDQWLTFANGENFTQESLGYVVDSFPQMLENAKTSGQLSRELERLAKGTPQSTKSEGSRENGSDVARSQWAQFWYPTVSLNMEVKKALPAEGTEWLFSRVKAKQICNGRMDIDIVILDQERDIIALSNHIALIIPAERNVLRGGKDKHDTESKL